MSRMPLPPSPPPSLSSKAPTLPFSPKKTPPMPVYKDLHFNHDLSATKKLQVTHQRFKPWWVLNLASCDG